MTISILAILAILILIFIRIPIAFALFIVGYLGIWYLRGFETANSVLYLQQISGVISSDMAALPLFILIGSLALTAGIASDGYEAARAWLGRLPGGLGIATIAASSVFAASSGSSVAGAVTMGKIAIPEMRKSGYSDSLSTGISGAGGLLATMIPPSGMMVLYGLATGESIGRLLIAGIFPGILLVISFILGIIMIAKLKPEMAPTIAERTSWQEKFSALPKLSGVFIIFGTVFIGLFSGFFTVTEAAAWGAFATFILLIIKTRKKFPRKFIEACIEAASITVSLLFIVLGAYVFSNLLIFAGLPVILSDMILGSELNPYFILFIIILTFFILGMFMDGVTMLMITMPIYYPIVIELGFNGIWFGVIVIALIEVGMVTPPLGIVGFSLKSVVPDVDITTIFKGCMIFMVIQLFVVLLIVIFPEIATFLPDLMK